MDSSRSAQAPSPSSDAIDFVRFCYRRRRVGWPELYDEMCAVAGRGLYRGWRFAELEEHGIGFSLHQTLELAGSPARSQRRRETVGVGPGPVGGPGRRDRRRARRDPDRDRAPEEPVIDVPILVAVAAPSDPVDEAIATAAASASEPAISSTRPRPARPSAHP